MKMQETVTIREAQEQDNQIIKTMIFTVLKEYGVEAEPDGDDLDAVGFGLNNDRIYIVAEISGQPVGSAILTPSDDGAFKLSKLFLPSAMRGKGIGRKLLNSSVESAAKAGATEVYLRTRDTYEEAIKLYDAAGWQRSSEPLPPPGPPVKYSVNAQPA